MVTPGVSRFSKDNFFKHDHFETKPVINLSTEFDRYEDPPHLQCHPWRRESYEVSKRLADKS